MPKTTHKKNMNVIFCLTLLAVLTGAAIFTSCKKQSSDPQLDPPIREKTISDLVDADRIMKTLGKDWKRHPTLIVNKLDDFDALTGVKKQEAELTAKQAGPHGVIAFGEFSFSRTVFPLNNITIKVFRFSTPEKAAAFRKLKYEHENVKSLYTRTENGSTIIYDSLEINKRIVFRGTLWITSSHLADDDLHIRILDKYVKLQ